MKIGRPKKIVPADMLPAIEALAARGVNERTIAAACGVLDNKVFLRVKTEQPEVQEAIDRGRAAEHDALQGVLYEACVNDKNIVSCMFLLKARHGYREGESQVGQQVNVTISLPGALAPEAYGKVIENGTEPKQLSSKRLKRS